MICAPRTIWIKPIRAQPQVTCISKVYKPNRHPLVRHPAHTQTLIRANMITSRIVRLNNAISWVNFQYIFNLFLNMLKLASSLANLMGAAPPIDSRQCSLAYLKRCHFMPWKSVQHVCEAHRRSTLTYACYWHWGRSWREKGESKRERDREGGRKKKKRITDCV